MIKLIKSPIPKNRFKLIRNLSKNIQICEYKEINYILKYTEAELELKFTFNHDNIIKIFYNFLPNDNYILMEYSKLGDLYDFLQGRKKIPLAEDIIWNYISQLGNALEYLHSINLIHRDVKSKVIL